MDVSELFDVKGKVIVITGANKGIGRDLATFLARTGCKLAIIARNELELTTVADDIESLGCDVLPVSFDLTKTDEIPAVMEKIHGHFGRIDVLINNAGTNIFQPPEDVTEETWDKIMNINMKSTFFASQAAGKYMKEQQKGKIINMSSQMAFVGYYDRTVYSASKAGASQLTKTLAIEWASNNVNVNAIAPTFIETPMTRQSLDDETFRKEVLGRIPLRRLSKTRDLFGAVLYLASPASDMMTGQTMIIDGGWTAW